MVRLRSLMVASLLTLAFGCSGGAARPPADPIQGLIVSIEGMTMTVEIGGGERYSFTISDPTVPLEHLREHMVQRLPVSVDWDGTDELVARVIADA
ncbi:MAG TPA: hypothetical protein VGB52_01325 [Actinomycetota bacterium]|jgi:hypothetical protein